MTPIELACVAAGVRTGPSLLGTTDPMRRVLRFGQIAWAWLTGYRVQPWPYLMHVEVTHRCNLRCRYCSCWQTPAPKRHDELSTAQWQRAIEQARDMGVRVVAFTGGEPLLRGDLFELGAYGRSLGLETYVNSNGLLVRPENVRDLVNSFDTVDISIDSADPAVHDGQRGRVGSHKVALRALDLLVKHRRPGMGLTVTAVVYPGNVDTLHRLNRYLKRRRVQLLLQPEHADGTFTDRTGARHPIAVDEFYRKMRQLWDNVYSPFWGQKFYFADFYHYLGSFLAGRKPPFRCFAGSLNLQVSPYGDVMVCQLRRHGYGNVAHTPLADIFTRMRSARRYYSSRKRACYCWLQCTSLHYLKPYLLLRFAGLSGGWWHGGP